MAKQNDITTTVLNIGIIAAVVAGIWFLVKYLREHGLHFGDGSGGNGTAPGNKGTGGSVLDDGHKLGNKLSLAYQDTLLNPTLQKRFGYELALADEQAKKYWTKAGTNVIINKVLKAVNKLDDQQFAAAITEWKKIGGWKSFYDTQLVGAKIYTGEHSNFLVRYQRITGNPAVAGYYKTALMAAI